MKQIYCIFWVISNIYLEEVEQHAEDAAYPGHEGAGAHGLVPDHRGEHLRRVDEDDGEHGAGPELAHQGQDHLARVTVTVRASNEGPHEGS